MLLTRHVQMDPGHVLELGDDLTLAHNLEIRSQKSKFQPQITHFATHPLQFCLCTQMALRKNVQMSVMHLSGHWESPLSHHKLENWP